MPKRRTSSSRLILAASCALLRYDPAFLQQLIGVSIQFSLSAGEKKTQDLRVAGGS